MKTQLFGFLGLFLHLISLQAQSLTSTSDSFDEINKSQENRRNITKQYSFCNCIHRFAELDSLEFQDGSLAMYRDMLDYGFSTVFRLDSFVDNFVVTVKSDSGEVHHDNPYPCNIASCLWLMSSKELEHFLDYLDREEGILPKKSDKKKRKKKPK